VERERVGKEGALRAVAVDGTWWGTSDGRYCDTTGIRTLGGKAMLVISRSLFFVKAPLTVITLLYYHHNFLLFLRRPIPFPYLTIQTKIHVRTDAIPVSPPVIATARSAREQMNPTRSPMTREMKSVASTTQQMAHLFIFCPISSADREGELDRRAGYWSAKEADDCRRHERWNAAVSSADGVREETITSSGNWLGWASTSGK
jgi:hypothetical protein